METGLKEIDLARTWFYRWNGDLKSDWTASGQGIHRSKPAIN
jgi:hypothetical protein